MRRRAFRNHKFVGSAIALGLVSVAVVSLFWLYGSYRVYIVHTGSMDPTIPSGSAVVVERHKYHAGQVVAFKTHGQTVTHRLESIRPDGKIVTRGDANQSDDPWMAQRSDIIGGVISAPSNLGYVLEYLRQPAGFMSVLLLVWLVFELEHALGNTVKRSESESISETDAASTEV